MKKSLKRFLPLAGLVIFSAAVWVLYNQLKSYDIKDILSYKSEIPGFSLAIAVILTAINYAVMTGYDYTALKYIGRKSSIIKTAFVSFTSYALSNNIGFGLITSSSIRFREYSAWGMSPFEITRVIAFCNITFLLGLFLTGGLALTFGTAGIPANPHLSFYSFTIAGIILLFMALGYIMLVIFRKKPFSLFGLSVELPRITYLIPQFFLSSLDWILAAGVLYILFRDVPGLTFFSLIVYYFIAVTAGLVSQVPGGLGVFETLMVILLTPYMPAAKIIGYLIIYRIIYYFIPFGIAICITAVRELLRLKTKLGTVPGAFARYGSGVVPAVMALTSFFGGAVLLFSGVTPAASSRLEMLVRFIPVPVFELSHFLGSVAGLGLILLSRGIHHRLNSAYLLTIVLLFSGICLSIIKGLDIKEALILSFMLAAFIPTRRHFYRKTSLLDQHFNPGWLAMIIVVVISAILLGFFSYKHVEYSNELWWNFEIYGNASRFMRAGTGIGVLTIVFGLYVLLKRKPPESGTNDFQLFERIIPIISDSGDTYANLALMGDKNLLINGKNNAFIMYGLKNRTWVAMGDPIGPEEEWPELAWRFHEISDIHDGMTAFYEVSPQALPLYLDLGLTPLKIGEEARIDLERFSISGNRRKSLRHTLHRLEDEGLVFEIAGPDKTGEIMPALAGISQSWLKEKNTREKGFSLGFFREEYVRRFSTGIVRKNDNIVAFVTIWTGAKKEEVSPDLMRFSSEAPAGTMDYLFTKLILWGKEEGYNRFNLGMAPLSGLESRALSPGWNRLGSFIYRHAEHFYNFQGIRQYKEKFDPVWEPRYLALRAGFGLPVTLANIAALISGGVKGIIAK